jgi:hypothetical protein
MVREDEGEGALSCASWCHVIAGATSSGCHIIRGAHHQGATSSRGGTSSGCHVIRGPRHQGATSSGATSSRGGHVIRDHVIRGAGTLLRLVEGRDELHHRSGEVGDPHDPAECTKQRKDLSCISSRALTGSSQVNRRVYQAAQRPVVHVSQGSHVIRPRHQVPRHQVPRHQVPRHHVAGLSPGPVKSSQVKYIRIKSSRVAGLSQGTRRTVRRVHGGYGEGVRYV